MTYLDGDLTIVSPQLVHDMRRLWRIMTPRDRSVAGALPDSVSSRSERRRSARRVETPLAWGRSRMLRGILPRRQRDQDSRNKTELDLSIDPPPNLALGSRQHDHSSEAALPTYARIGVPEVWRFDAVERTLWFGRLVEDHYEELGRSINLPRLTPTLVIEAARRRGCKWLTTPTGSTGSNAGPGTSPRRIEADHVSHLARELPEVELGDPPVAKPARRGSLDDRPGHHLDLAIVMVVGATSALNTLLWPRRSRSPYSTSCGDTPENNVFTVGLVILGVQARPGYSSRALNDTCERWFGHLREFPDRSTETRTPGRLLTP